MRLVRPSKAGDLSALVDLANSLGPGMTTLPADRNVLAEKISNSIASFQGNCDPSKRQYLLVLEDAQHESILGVAAVYPQVGRDHGFFSYKRLRLVHRCAKLGISNDVPILSLTNDYTGATEVGSLAVRPEVRGTGAAQLLARSRYMLMAVRPDLFAPTVMAELRGWQDEQGRSPFWEAVGSRFFGFDFHMADRISATEGSEFISQLLPKYPIYVDLLPAEVQSAIGRPHPKSAPALAMLMTEGFRQEGYVDVFDAGPQLHVERDLIRTVRMSSEGYLAEGRFQAAVPAPVMVAVSDISCFKVIECNASADGENVVVPPEALRALDKGTGASVRSCSSHLGRASICNSNQEYAA